MQSSSDPQKISTTRLGITLILLAALSMVWYLCCPYVSIAGVQEWRRDSSSNQTFNYAEKASFIIIRDPNHFWPGLAIIWPAVFGLSLLTKPKIFKES